MKKPVKKNIWYGWKNMFIKVGGWKEQRIKSFFIRCHRPENNTKQEMFLHIIANLPLFCHNYNTNISSKFKCWCIWGITWNKLDIKICYITHTIHTYALSNNPQIPRNTVAISANLAILSFCLMTVFNTNICVSFSLEHCTCRVHLPVFCALTFLQSSFCFMARQQRHDVLRMCQAASSHLQSQF